MMVESSAAAPQRNGAVPAAMADPAVTIWFDSACPLCSREIALMRRLDRAGRIEFVDLLDQATTCPVAREDMLARFHAREGDTLHAGAAAFAAMWRTLPALRWLGQLARLPGMLWLLERAYRQFLRVRPFIVRRLR